MTDALSPTATSILPLRIEDLILRLHRRQLLGPLSLTLSAGPRSIILGPNGAGKSLLLRMCHGLLRPTGGTIAWQAPAAIARGRQAMVFQRPVLLRRSVAANVDFALKLRRVADSERPGRVAAALDATGLAPLSRQPARSLSGGEQQRLALARAWAVQPEVLFLDEPTASLDPAATKAIEDVIRTVALRGIKVVMSTHDLGEAKRLAGEIVLMHRGRVIETGPAEDFFSEPKTEEARRFTAGELLV